MGRQGSLPNLSCAEGGRKTRFVTVLAYGLQEMIVGSEDIR
jgi:hypothetical protein